MFVLVSYNKASGLNSLLKLLLAVLALPRLHAQQVQIGLSIREKGLFFGDEWVEIQLRIDGRG